MWVFTDRDMTSTSYFEQRMQTLLKLLIHGWYSHRKCFHCFLHGGLTGNGDLSMMESGGACPCSCRRIFAANTAERREGQTSADPENIGPESNVRTNNCLKCMWKRDFLGSCTAVQRLAKLGKNSFPTGFKIYNISMGSCRSFPATDEK